MQRRFGWFALALALAAGPGCSSAPPAPTFTIGVLEDPAGLDPARHDDAASLVVSKEIFQTLVQLRPGTFDVEPDAALSWKVSPDARTWTFRLQPGLQFSDGTPLDAAAVKLNFDRWRLTKDPNHDDTPYPAYAQYFGGFDDASQITSVDAPDPATVIIRTKDAFAPLLRDLTLPSFSIGSPKAIGYSTAAFDELPVGSGRFAVQDWWPNDHIAMNVNPHWHGPQPPVASLVVRFIPDPPTSVLSLEKDDIDVLTDPTPQIARDIASRSGMRLFHGPSDSVCYLGFDLSRPPFDDERARRAIAAALDPVAIAKLFGSSEVGPAGGWLPPGMLGSDAAIEPLRRDVPDAKALLAGANFPHGPVSLFYPNLASALVPDPGGTAQLIAAELAEAGLEVDVQPAPGTAFPVASGGNPQLQIAVARATSGDPNEAFAPLALTWNDAQFAALLDAGRKAPDDASRAGIYRSAQALVRQHVAAIPLVHPFRWSAAVSTVDPKVVALP
jgi:peptide/nickel transport system substrate-binding protein